MGCLRLSYRSEESNLSVSTEEKTYALNWEVWIAGNSEKETKGVEVQTNGGSDNVLDKVLDYLPGDRDVGSEFRVIGGAIVAANGKKFAGATVNLVSSINYEATWERGKEKVSGRNTGLMQNFAISPGAWGIEYKNIWDENSTDDNYEISIGVGPFVFKLNWGTDGTSFFYGGSLGGTVGGGIGIDAETWHGNRITW